MNNTIVLLVCQEPFYRHIPRLLLKSNPMKKIVTHINPDADAVTSVWLIKRFLPGWEKAEIEFIQADVSITPDDHSDRNPNCLYVDIGRGKLDHHQVNKYTSAAELCLKYIESKTELTKLTKESLKRLVNVVTEVDNAADLKWSEIKTNRYPFYFHLLLDGLRGVAENDQTVIEYGFRSLEAILWNLKNKIKAEEELKTGIKFKTHWGLAIAVLTSNKRVLWEGEVAGYVLVVIKDPEKGGVQIYSRPDSRVDLTKAYNKVRQLDRQSDWFLHITKRLLLNHSSVNPKMRPTKLSLDDIIKEVSK